MSHLFRKEDPHFNIHKKFYAIIDISENIMTQNDKAESTEVCCLATNQIRQKKVLLKTQLANRFSGGIRIKLFCTLCVFLVIQV